MSTSRRRRDDGADLCERNANKRQRVDHDPRLDAIELFDFNDMAVPDITADPIVAARSPAVRTRELITPAPDTHQVTYLVGRKKRGQPDSRHAVINLHGRKKDVEQCIAFLEKYSPSDNNDLVAKLVKSPTMSIKDSLEIRSWSTEIETPRYCAEMELWQKPFALHSPAVSVASPYPQHVSITLHSPSVTPEPERVLILPEFDYLQIGLRSMRDRVIDSLQRQSNPTQAEMRAFQASQHLHGAISELVASVNLSAFQGKHDDSHIHVQQLNRNLMSVYRFSPLYAIVQFFGLLVLYDAQTRMKRFVCMILESIALHNDGEPESLLALIARSLLTQTGFVPNILSRYVQCMVDILHPRLHVTNSIVFDMHARLVLLHKAAGERNSGLSVLHELFAMVEANKHLMDHFDLNSMYVRLTETSYHIGEYDMALKYASYAVECTHIYNTYYTRFGADILLYISSCYTALRQYEPAYHASSEAMNIAIQASRGISPISMDFYQDALDMAYQNLARSRLKQLPIYNPAYMFAPQPSMQQF